MRLGPLTSDIINDMCWDDDDAQCDVEPCDPTWPAVGSATLEVVDLYEPMFTSVTWTVVLKVNSGSGMLTIPASGADDHQHSPDQVKDFARQAIRLNVVRLTRLGVDVKKEYVALGGDPNDV